VTPFCLIPVLCPHCGAAFAIDPALETASITDGTGAQPTGDPPVAFRPVCPRCQRRVPVRVTQPLDDF
jgi:hypothetical protein